MIVRLLLKIAFLFAVLLFLGCLVSAINDVPINVSRMNGHYHAAVGENSIPQEGLVAIERMPNPAKPPPGIDVYSSYGPYWFGQYHFNAPARRILIDEVSIPFWTTLPLAFLPAAVIFVAMLKQRRRRRHREAFDKGVCIRCGYDLKATPERCPECGTVPSPA